MKSNIIKILLIVGSVVLVAAIVMGCIVGPDIMYILDAKAVEKAFQAENMAGRWTIPEKDWSFLIYWNGYNYSLRTDMWFNSATGEGMFDGSSIYNSIGGLLGYGGGLLTSMEGPNGGANSLGIYSDRRANKDNTVFDISSMHYDPYNDPIVNAEYFSSSCSYKRVLWYQRPVDYKLTFVKDDDMEKWRKDSVGVFDIEDLPSEKLEEIIRLVSDTVQSYYGQDYYLIDFSWDDSYTYSDGFWSTDGLIHCTGVIAPVDGSSVLPGWEGVDFALDPVREEFILKDLRNYDTGEDIVVNYKRQ